MSCAKSHNAKKKRIALRVEVQSFLFFLLQDAFTNSKAMYDFKRNLYFLLKETNLEIFQAELFSIFFMPKTRSIAKKICKFDNTLYMQS